MPDSGRFGGSALKSICVFHMFMPKSHGGLELNLPSALEIIRTLGRIDGSVGWTAMIGSGSDLSRPLLPRDTYDEIYLIGSDVILAGSAQPTYGHGRGSGCHSMPAGWTAAHPASHSARRSHRLAGGVLPRLRWISKTVERARVP
ncbi:MAG TPA: hypothetical protein VK638_38880 [Edaphobacter sp.]|nr:hypothetical protein [Edaphobacter sp.]